MKLKQHEVLPQGLRRIARERLDEALAYLRGDEGSDVEERVHEARKSLKKTRAAIRLVRREVGEEVFDRENVRFRDAGRVLAPVRDAEVFVETLDRLVSDGPLDRERMRPLRERLQEHRTETRRRVIDDERALERVEAVVLEGRGMVDAWPIDRVNGAAIRDSIKKTYKRARKGFHRAYEEPSGERFHELRKRIKYLWYYARLLKPAAWDEIDELKDRTDVISDILGLDHDLFELLGAARDLGVDPEQLDPLERAAEQRRLELEWEALPLLRRALAEPPAAFADRVASRYDAWRYELGRSPSLWLTPAAAARASELLSEKPGADRSRSREIRSELDALGLGLSALAERVEGAGAGFEAHHLESLIADGEVGAGTADRLPTEGEFDRPLAIEVEIAPNEASGICPIDSEASLERLGFDHGFWVVLDDTGVGRGLVAVGRGAEPGSAWEALPVPFSRDDGLETDDGEDCVRIGQWVYVLGSHYGSKGGPLERDRQFVARFRQSSAGAEETRLEVAGTAYRLHRLLNDALANSAVEPFELAHAARSALIGEALTEEEGSEGLLERGLEPADLPINIEGCAARTATGTVLLGLRFPVSRNGHPLLIEIDSLEPLFETPSAEPEVFGVWELTGIGNRWVPAGVRGLGEGPEGAIEVLTGNLDSTGKGSVLIEHHPEAALALSAHHRLELPSDRQGGAVGSRPVREFPGLRRVEGVAFDPIGRPVYVIDEAERVSLRRSPC